MKLIDYIENLRGQLHDTHAEALRLLDAVGQRIFENDCEVMRKLEEIQEGQARRAADIIRLAQTIAARVGCVPHDAFAGHYVNGNARGGLAPTPLDGGHRAMRELVRASQLQAAE